MGIKALFDNTASIPKIAHGRGLAKKLQISNILQKAGIDVNEVGTTAYAATGMHKILNLEPLTLLMLLVFFIVPLKKFTEK